CPGSRANADTAPGTSRKHTGFFESRTAHGPSVIRASERHERRFPFSYFRKKLRSGKTGSAPRFSVGKFGNLQIRPFVTDSAGLFLADFFGRRDSPSVALGVEGHRQVFIRASPTLGRGRTADQSSEVLP